MTHRILLLIQSFALCITLNTATGQSLPPKENFHLFLLAGQSNMAGRGIPTMQDSIAHPRVLTLNKDNEWVPAIDPIHFDKRVAGVGLGRSFGITLADADPNITIGLIPCAAGGSPINSWRPGQTWHQTKSAPYDDALRRTERAMQDGTLKGILWNQGGSDSKPELAQLYEAKLTDLIARFRTDFHNPQLPFIIGQLGKFSEKPWDQHRETVNDAHRNIAATVPFTEFVSATGLSSKSDLVHFNSLSLREFGRRYAESFAKVYKPRLIVMTDIGGDPDDQQSMVRLLVTANEFDIEGFIATASGTPGELKKSVVRPELIHQMLDAYGNVRDNLLLHSPEYPATEQLKSIVTQGNPVRGVESVGSTHDTQGSNWIISVVDRSDPRPVNITIWGGSTALAQALWRIRNDRSPADAAKFISKIRVYDIAQQDNTGQWILDNFPDLWYILNKAPADKDKRLGAFRGMYLGGDESLTSRAWMDMHIRHNHGPLGALYPPKTWTAPNPHSAIKEGDTPSWFYFLPNGLQDTEHPEWGGWGGRFVETANNRYRDAQDAIDGVTHARATVWRWRGDFQNDFRSRLDWCVKPFAQANHHPQARLDGPLQRTVRPGDTVRLNAADSTDPDGDALDFGWSFYPEPSTLSAMPVIRNASLSTTEFVAPDVTKRAEYHVILKVTDKGVPPLTAYQRVVVTVRN
jgi:hypothetical protein